MAYERMRFFNKHVINRVTRVFAHSRRGPFAVICHVGRRSGKSYETPLIVAPLGERLVVMLTYGPEVDWYRNLQTAGHATLRWHGGVYTLEKPEPVAVQTAVPAFPTLLRLIIRMGGPRQFVGMKYREVPKAAETFVV